MDKHNRKVIATMCQGVLWFYSRCKYLMRTKTNAYQILTLMNSRQTMVVEIPREDVKAKEYRSVQHEYYTL